MMIWILLVTSANFSVVKRTAVQYLNISGMIVVGDVVGTSHLLATN